MQELGGKVLYTVKHHRKLAVIDDVLWEGSLNILSQNDSCEIMRRTLSSSLAVECCTSREYISMLLKSREAQLEVGDVVPLLDDISNKRQEHFVVLTFNSSKKLINKHLVFLGR